MSRDTIVIIFLSIQVTVMGFFISRLCYRLGYEEGRASLIWDRAGEGDTGTSRLRGIK